MSYDESVPELTVQEALDILVAWDHVKREAKLEEAWVAQALRAVLPDAN